MFLHKPCFTFFIVYWVAFYRPFRRWGWNGVFTAPLALSFLCLMYLWYWHGVANLQDVANIFFVNYMHNIDVDF